MMRKTIVYTRGVWIVKRTDFSKIYWMKYIDRKHAGLVLAELLKDYAHRTDVIVLALPRGGVPVAYEIATALSLALDVFIVRKLGVPAHEEFAMGAIASGGVIVLNDEVIQALRISQSMIDTVLQKSQQELLRREHLYRGDRAFPELSGRTIILVDDGIATGYTMKAALVALLEKKPAEMIVAVPTASSLTCDEISGFVKTIICPLRPTDFHAVGLWYDDFSQTTDEEVIDLLEKSNRHLKPFSDT